MEKEVQPVVRFFYTESDGNLNKTTGSPENNDPFPNFISIDNTSTEFSSVSSS